VPDEISPFSAYESPPAAEPAPTGVPRPEGPLRVPCIMALFLGGGGLLTGLAAFAALLFGQSVQAAFTPAPGAPQPEMVRIQQQMQAAIQAIQDQFFLLNIVLAAVHVLVAAFLLIAAVKCLRMSTRGPRLLQAACSLAAGYEIVRCLAQLPLQWQTMSATNFYIELMFDSSGNVPAGVLQFSLLITKVLLFVSLLLGFGWVLAKVLFYVYTVRRCRRPDIQAAFASSTEL